MVIALGVLLLLLVTTFAGYSASIACLVLERRLAGRRPTGRSVCVCGTPIPLYRNIPIVSWVLQRGRTACCGARIPSWYLGAEVGSVVSALAATLVLRRWPFAGPLVGTATAVLVLWWWHRVRFERGSATGADNAAGRH